MGYLEMIAENKHILSFTYKCGHGAFTLDLNNAVEMFTISDFKKFFAIADSSEEGSFTIAEKVQSFASCRLEYEKTFTGLSKNEKLIAKLEKILVFLADSFGISCDVEKPEKVTKKRGTGIIVNVDNSGTKTAEAVTGDFYKIGGIWYFIHKKPEIKRGGYCLTSPAYGARVAAFGYFKTAKEAIAWITENGISQKLLNPPSEGRARAAEMRARFLEAVENSGLSWVIESNPAYFEDFLTATEAEKTAENPENVPTEATTEVATEKQVYKTRAYIDRINTKKVTRLYIYKTFRKAPKKAKYNASRVCSKSPYSIYLQKIGFQVMKYHYTDHKAKISMYSGKTFVGFYTGVSPPWGVSKNFTLKFAAKKFLGGLQNEKYKKEIAN